MEHSGDATIVRGTSTLSPRCGSCGGAPADATTITTAAAASENGSERFRASEAVVVVVVVVVVTNPRDEDGT